MNLKINNVHHMDAFKGIKLIDNDSVDMVFTDTPYGIDYQSNWGKSGKKLDKIKNDSNLEWFQFFSDECYRVLKNNTAGYFFSRYDVYPHMYNCLIKSGFKVKNLLTLQKGQKGGNGDLKAQYSNDCELLIYVNKGRNKFNKTELVPNDGRTRIKNKPKHRTRLSNVWFDVERLKQFYPPSTVNVSKQHKEAIIHPTEKNYELIRWFLQISSNKDDLILDPFMGSGSTAVACILEERNFLGFEIEDKYIKLINDRIYNLQNNLYNKNKDIFLQKNKTSY